MERRNGTGLFMTELILVIMFFSVTAAGCLQVFAKAYQINRHAEAVKAALNSTESVIQILKSGTGDMSGLIKFFPEMDVEKKLISFENSGRSCEADAADFQMSIEESRQDTIWSDKIVCKDLSGEELYQIEIERIAGAEWDEE